MLKTSTVFGPLIFTKHSKVLVTHCFDQSFFSIMSNNAQSGNTVNEQKNRLRTIIKNKLKGISEQDKLRQTFIITNRILNHPHFLRAERLAIYVNMKNEVATYDIIKEAFDRKKEVFIPLTIGNDMKMVKLNSFDELKTFPKNNWGIIQPNNSDNRQDCLENGGVQYVIVPGVAFTSNGLRLGHGKGYYDRFLAENDKVTKSKAITVGLAYDEQVVEHLPTTDSDFKLDWVIHPEAFALSVEYLDIPERFSPPPEPFTI